MSNSKLNNQKERARRIRKRIRKKISGTEDRPRVFILKSNRYIYLQAIDDVSGRILASASTLEKEVKAKSKGTKNIEISQQLGEIMAERLKKLKKKDIVFDRGLYPYHGRLKAVAEAMRKGGLHF